MLFNKYGETVTLYIKSKDGRDASGNQKYTETPASLEKIPVWYRTTSEVLGGQDVVISGLTAILPTGTVLDAIDTVEIFAPYFAGRYSVDGDVFPLRSSLSGHDRGILVQLTKVT